MEMDADLRSKVEGVKAEIEANRPGMGVVAGMSPLSQALWKEKMETEFLGDVSARLSWKDLTVTATVGGEAKVLLSGVTGYAKPRTLTAVMGPSGSGKSTLLDSLSGRLASNAFLYGSILLNGRKTKLSFGTAACVTQEDNLVCTLTVRETLSYSARLRLPDEMPWREKMLLVEGAIDEMGLRDCANTPIGNWHLRGISTGEKRRVSIAVEILTRPRLLFLDEPTSGLDSASAFSVVQTLRNLARDGRTVLAAVHQPSNEVFDLFDCLCLLSGGQVVYFGKTSEACDFFNQAGFPCPLLRNPSDHFLRCVNSDFDRVGATIKRVDGSLVEGVTAAEAAQRLIQFYNASSYSFSATEEVDAMSKVEGMVLESGGSQASFLSQTRALTKRSFTNMSRDFGYYWLRLLMYVFVTVSIGTINWNLGTSYKAIQARGACYSFVLGFVTFMSVGGFPSFVEDMKVFKKERLNGHYGVAAFTIGNTLSAMPFVVFICLISGSICYSMVRLHPGFSHYLYFVLLLFASVAIVESLMMVIATFVPNFHMGIMIGAGMQGIFLLVSGHYRRPNDLPKILWRYPLSFISFHFWALQGQSKNDLKGLSFDNQSPELPRIPGEYLLKNYLQVNTGRSKWIDLGILFGMIVFYRLMFFASIKLGEHAIPRMRRRAAWKSLLRQTKTGGGAVGNVPLVSPDLSPSPERIL